MAQKDKLRVREPRFADNRWYSSTPHRLREEIETYLGQGETTPQISRLVGLIAPHAGYRFSGHVAGTAFAPLKQEDFETVVLLGPDHRGAAPGEISTTAVDMWRTPLGDIPVAWERLKVMQNEIDITLLSYEAEHSLEIELPFLQRTLGHFNLVPLMMGTQNLEHCHALGEALAKDDSTLLVASSDLSHYFDDDTARQLDQETLQFVLDLDSEGLIAHIQAGRRAGKPLACGAGPIATLIHAAKARGANQAKLMKYATSADVHPRKDNVVGYAAVAIGR